VVIYSSLKSEIATYIQVKGYTYTEQIVWREAAAGKILAQSDFFPAMSPGILVTPGYGGVMYELLYNGHIMALQVAPALKTSGNETNANPALLQSSVYNYTSILEIKGKGLVKRRWHLRWRLLYLPLELRKVPIEKVHL
jgi:hypothetical protein